MPKSLLLISICCLFLFYGCKKEKHESTPEINNIKVSILSGDNQSSVTGKALTDSVVIKVTKNGAPLIDGVVQFTGSGCNSDLTVQLNTKADGTAKYLWRLAANQGPQTLNIIAFDGTVKADSVQAHAIATSQNDPSISACTPYNMPPVNIVKLSTGRLLACFQGKASLRYSDDNAISWNPVKSFGTNHYTLAIVITPQDEIFAATFGDGIYYSKDAGATWTDITPPTFNKVEGEGDMAYTNNGTLIFTGGTSGTNQVFISTDKGKTWTNSSAGLDTKVGYLYPCKLNNGDLYLVGLNAVLYKSVDNGKNWVAQNDLSTTETQSIYVDNNGWFYKSTTTNTGGFSTIYISKDSGTTFQVLYTIRDFVYSMSILQDGHLYYSDFSGLYQIYNQDNISMLAYSDGGYDRSYLLNQNKLIYVNVGLIRRVDD